MTALRDAELPMSVEELTREWFAAALDADLTDVSIERIVAGSATKVLARVTYASGAAGPERVCVKGGFDPEMRQFAVGEAYRREAEFFRRIAPGSNIPLPACWYAEENDAQGQGVVIMEDLAAAGATFGDPTVPWPADRVAAGLEVLAKLHAETWGVADRHPWLTARSPVADVIDVLLSPVYWDELMGGDAAPDLPTALADRDRMGNALRTLWRQDEADATSVAHGDPHLGNTYIGADGAPGFIDWQCAYAAPGMHDVAYFVGGALTVADRRSHEEDLLRVYLAALSAAGVDAAFRDAWEAYRRQHVHGFIWALTSPRMQPQEIISAMTERHVAAIEDHDSVAAVLGGPR